LAGIPSQSFIHVRRNIPALSRPYHPGREKHGQRHLGLRRLSNVPEGAAHIESLLPCQGNHNPDFALFFTFS